MKRLCLLAITVLTLSGCVTPTQDHKFGMVILEPEPQVLTYQLKNGPYPNVMFCALTKQQVFQSYAGVSMTRNGSLIYAFKRFGLDHPDTWLFITKQEDVSNRWPHRYAFDLDGNGAADVFFLDFKRDGTCDLQEVGPEETT